MIDLHALRHFNTLTLNHQPVPAPYAERKPKSKYTLTETPDGFRVSREGGLEVEVKYADTYIWIGEYKQGIYCYPQIVDCIAMWFAERLVKRERDQEEAAEMIARALNKRIKPHWERIIEQIVPDDVKKLARLMWSSVRGDARVLHYPSLYTDTHTYTRRDLATYAACRLFAKSMEGYDRYMDLKEEAFLAAVADWRNQLAPAVAYKGLNKTLDKIPPAVSFRQIQRLSLMQLEQPITNRLHLIFALCGADHHNWGLHERAVLTATPEEIIQAALLFDCHVNTRSRTTHISHVASRILDYPQAYHGDLIGLTRRSVEWHREIVQNGDHRDYKLSPDTVLPRPDLDFEALANQGVFFLNTAGNVFQEGRLMHHCVASYASKAAAGKCYLFHVEHDGEQATVEVSPKGIILQAAGPFDRNNAACTWGMEVLRAAFERKLLPEGQAE